MAAPMKTARIGLSFDNFEIENCWFLVNFSKHSRVEDVSNEIKSNYFDDMTYCDLKVVLRINNFLLPPSASSELFRENDIVTVRLEPTEQNKATINETEAIQKVPGKWVHSSSDVSSSQTDSTSSLARVVKNDQTIKRKRTHSESDSSKRDQSPNQKKKHKKTKHKKTKHNKRSDTEEDLEQIGTESTKNNEEKKRSKEKGDIDNIDNELKQDTEDNVADIRTEMSLDDENQSLHSDKSSVNSSGTRKRVRKRRRHKKHDSTKVDFSDANGDSRKFGPKETYQGIDVDKNERGLYGYIPDKLEPPKYYRHGYRNLNTYAVEPNKHIKFDEDCKPDITEESTKQYNFLCKSRKNTDEILGNNESETVSDSQNITPVTDTNLDESFSSQNDSKAYHNDTKSQGNCEESRPSSQNESYTTIPFNYDNSSLDTNFDNTKNKSVAMEMSPVTLERKLLSNGVSVFVRKKPSQASPIRGFSKQEQLDTKMTNVSTIFVNPPINKEFKVPSSPATKLEFTTKQCSSNVIGSRKDAFNLHSDFSERKPLVGAPDVGDIIAYKVLEISATCTPEVSGYKVAKVLSVNDKQMLELKNLHQSDDSDKQITKFHVEIEDDNEILTNTENHSDVVTLHLSSLLEPKKVESA